MRRGVISRSWVFAIVPVAGACGLGVVGVAPSVEEADASADHADTGPSSASDVNAPEAPETSSSSSSSSSSGSTSCKVLSFSSAAQDYFEVPDHADFNSQGPLTLEAWVRPTAAGLATDMDVVSHRSDFSNLGWTLMIQQRALQFRLYGDNAQFLAGDVPGHDLVPGVWTHLAGSFDGTKLRSFVNGTLTETTDPPSSIALFAGTVRVGMSAENESNWFDGEIAEVRISKTALYLDSFTPPKPPLAIVAGSTIALYRSTGAQDNIAADETGNHPGRLGLSAPADDREPSVITSTLCP